MKNMSWILQREPNSKFIHFTKINSTMVPEILIDPVSIATGHIKLHSSKTNSHWSYQYVLLFRFVQTSRAFTPSLPHHSFQLFPECGLMGIVLRYRPRHHTVPMPN